MISGVLFDSPSASPVINPAINVAPDFISWGAFCTIPFATTFASASAVSRTLGPRAMSPSTKPPIACVPLAMMPGKPSAIPSANEIAASIPVKITVGNSSNMPCTKADPIVDAALPSCPALSEIPCTNDVTRSTPICTTFGATLVAAFIASAITSPTAPTIPDSPPASNAAASFPSISCPICTADRKPGLISLKMVMYKSSAAEFRIDKSPLRLSN